MPMLVELSDIVEVCDRCGCAAVKMNSDKRFGFADYVFCYLDAEQGHYYANFVRNSQYGLESWDLGAYAESGEIILQRFLRVLYMLPEEDYINSQIVIDQARELRDAEYFDLLDADSMLDLYDRGEDIEIGQVY